jgi:CubicO group peptidase (beta-lactamase class C family)
MNFVANNSNPKTLLILFILLCLSNVKSQPITLTENDSYWPGEEWRTSSPEDQGIDPKILSDALDYVEITLEIDSFLLIRNGYLVEESYYGDYDRESLHWVYSVTKSVLSTLIGIAIQEGYIANVHEKVLDYFPDYEFENTNETKESITIHHLLTMSSGLEWDEWYTSYYNDNNDWTAVRQTSDWIQYILDKPMDHQPGEVMEYSTGTSHILSVILTRATGISAEAFANQYLYGPLGIENYYWHKDPLNYTVGGTWLSLRPVDMAKFGYLYLNNGTWNGVSIVNSEWIRNATYPWIEFDPQYNYGYQWWVPKSINPGVYFAWGFAGQRIFVIPERDIIVVFTSYHEGVSNNLFLKVLNQYIIPGSSYTKSENTSLTSTVNGNGKSSNGNDDSNFSLPSLLIAVTIAVILKKRRIQSMIFR